MPRADDGTVFEGEAIGADADAGATRRRGRVQHRAVGLPGDRHRPVVRGQIITFTYPHIGNYGVNDDDDESRRPFCRGVIVRDLARRPSNWRATGRPRRPAARATGCPGSPASTPAASPATCATRARSPARSVPTRRDASRAAARRDAAPTASTSSPTSRRPSRTSSAPTTAPFRVVAYDFGIKRTILATSSAVGCRVEVVPASTPRRRRARARARRRVPLERSRRPGRGRRRRRDGRAGCSARCRCSASASGTRSSASRSAADTYKLPFGHHGGNHPVRHEATGRVEITSQNHNYAVDADSLAGRRRASPT